MGGLSRAMLKRHLASYGGVFASMVLASALICGSVNLALASANLDGVDLAAVSEKERVLWKGASQILTALGGITAFVAILVSVVLIASTVAFVVEGRRRELALLRLNGARPGQIRRMVVGEVALLSLVASLVGALFTVPIARAYLAYFGATYQIPPGLLAGFHPDAVLLGVLITVGVASLAALGPARKVARVQAIEALSEGSTRRRPMTWWRWLSGGVAAAAAIGMFLLPPSIGASGFFYSALGAGLLSLVALVQWAPVIVAPISRAVCGLVARVAPGPGVLAGGHASWNAARTASLAAPALLLVAVPAVFFTTMFGLTDASTAELMRSNHADAVVDVVPSGPLKLDARVGQVEGVAKAVPLFLTKSDFWTGEGDELTNEEVLATDVPGLATLIDLKITGDPAAVRGHSIAIAPPTTHQVGDVVPMKGPAGRTVQATSVALVTGLPASRSTVVDAATFDFQGIEARSVTYFLDLDAGVTVDQVRPAMETLFGGPTAVKVMTPAEHSRMLSDHDNQQATTSLMVLLGGACLLSLLAIAVSIMTSLRERHAEFTLVRRAGGDEAHVLSATLIETLVIMAVAGALCAGVVAMVWGRLWQYYGLLSLPGGPPVPWGVLASFGGAGLLMALVATVVGTRWSLNAIRVE